MRIEHALLNKLLTLFIPGMLTCIGSCPGALKCEGPDCAFESAPIPWPLKSNPSPYPVNPALKCFLNLSPL